MTVAVIASMTAFSQILPIVAVYNEVFGGELSRVFYSEDDGETWTESSTVNAVEIGRVTYGGGTFLLWDVQDGSIKVEYSTDNGETWAQGTVPTGSVPIKEVVYVGGAFVASVAGGDVIRSTDGGATWGSAIATTLTVSQQATLGSDGTNIVAAHYNSGTPEISYSDDAGLTWSAATVPASSNNAFGQSIMGLNGSFTMIFDALNGDIIQSDDGGVTWAVRNITTSLSSFKTLNALRSKFLYMSGSESSNNFTSPAGITWGSIGNTNEDPSQQRGVCTYDDKIFIVGNSGTLDADVSISLDAGATWSSVLIDTLQSGETWFGQSISAATPNKAKGTG